MGLALGMVIFHQFGKKFKTQSQKVLGANSYVCRNYRERTKRGGLFGTTPHPPPPPPPPPPPFSNTSVLFKPRSEVYGLQHVDLGLH